MAHIGRPNPVVKLEFVPQNMKLADITEADLLTHTVSLSSLGLPANTCAIIITAGRIAGTGWFHAYPAGGARYIRIGTQIYQDPAVIAVVDNELTYALSVANDDWDIYIFGYWYQVRRRQ